MDRVESKHVCCSMHFPHRKIGGHMRASPSFSGQLPLVTVIMPVWNPRRDWLAQAVASAFQESGCQIELIMVDDGSDVPVSEWLAPADAARIRLIRIPHSGVSRARNVALQHSRGQFVRFLDSDDVSVSESTSLLLTLARTEPATIAYGSTIVCDSCLQPQGAMRSKLSGRIHWQVAAGHFHSMMQALLIPRHLALQGDGFDERLIVQSDWDFVLRIGEMADIRGTKEPVYMYRQHEASLTGARTPHENAARSTAIIIRGYLKRHPELRGTREERKVRAYAHFLITKFTFPIRSVFSAQFWRAVALDPVRGAWIAGTRLRAFGQYTVKMAAARVRQTVHAGR